MEAAKHAAAYDPGAGRLLADVLMELGDYDAAERALDDSPPAADDPNYCALRARLEAINGKPEAAVRLLRNAQILASNRPDLPAETVAWYHVTVARNALIESGQLEEGEQACRDALEIFPRDYRAMTGIAEAAAWRGDWRVAIEWGEKAVEISPQNPTAAPNSSADAHAAMGRDFGGRATSPASSGAGPLVLPGSMTAIGRCIAPDNGSDLDEALALARKDLELRCDLHAYDTLAWVCFKRGMLIEAESAMKQALSRGTREATLFYHAGMIARAGGDPARAKDCFTRAREINPHSIPLRWLRWMDSSKRWSIMPMESKKSGNLLADRRRGRP